MAIKRHRNRVGLYQAKPKEGTSGGGFGTKGSMTVTPGACLTFTDDDELGLAGANDLIVGFAKEIDNINNLISYEADYEIADILTNGTITPGSRIMGYSDTDRGKAIAATAAQAHNASNFVVKSSTVGKATVVAG